MYKRQGCRCTHCGRPVGARTAKHDAGSVSYTHLETADVISTYVYRRAFEGGEYSFSAAVGLFNSVINFIVIIVFNKISKRVSEVSLW